MIRLPALFLSKLSLNPVLLGAVQSSFAAFEPWLEHSGMPFFPGFTDHSPRHINDVLSTAASLVSDSSHDLLSAEDVSVLCMAILLHDCGMHVTADIFRNLIANSEPPIVPTIDTSSWISLWKDFLGEAHRWGQEKLMALFGESSPLRLDMLDLNNLAEKDFLLIGEFVRRHHTRLAHEIALTGVARAGADPIELLQFGRDFRDLAGLIARSHGMSIRATFEYLRTNYGTVAVYRDIKIPYLMAVLRIADYVQVKSERAIASLLSIKELRSPYSRQEWKSHFAVQDVHNYHADPEAFFVQAAPVDAKTFLRLSYLFKDIQRELDESWATLGEVYGRMGPLEKMGLTIRRIRSNLDSIETFEKTVTYFPVNAKFDSSGPDLLKLLVGPLYNYKSAVGIRELLQNAVDACREAKDLAGERGFPLLGTGEIDIVVEIVESEEGRGYVTITDQGVGMTLDTLLRYYLIAGASFRNSDVWKKQHMTQSGSSRVSRGGRFGVGALAAFLLGEEITVRTRHIDRPDKDGIEFRTTIDEPVVQLMHCSAPAGTMIRVEISNPQVLNELRPHFSGYSVPPDEVILDAWPAVDWFVEETPSVVYRWSGFHLTKKNAELYATKPKRVKCEFRSNALDFVPKSFSGDAGWNVLSEPSPYAGLLWQYKSERLVKSVDVEFKHTPRNEIVVNGIRVEVINSYDTNAFVSIPEAECISGPLYEIFRPTISIYDPAGVCPINLQRSSVSFNRMGIEGKLAASILESLFSDLVKVCERVVTIGDFLDLCTRISDFPGVKWGGEIFPFGWTSSGVFLANPSAMSSFSISTVFFLDGKFSDTSIALTDIFKDGEALFLRNKPRKVGPRSRLGWFRGIFSPLSDAYYARGIGIPLIRPTAQVSVMPIEKWEFVTEKGKVSRNLMGYLRNELYNSQAMIVCAGDVANIDGLQSRCLTLWHLMESDSEVAAWATESEAVFDDFPSVLLDAWMKIFKGPSFAPVRD
jgi:hypothetical protein